MTDSEWDSFIEIVIGEWLAEPTENVNWLRDGF